MTYGKAKWKNNNTSRLSKRFSYKSTKENGLDLCVAKWIGNHLIHLDKTKKGLEYYNDALEKKPLDENVLLKRAVANVKCFNVSAAAVDVENALHLDPKNMFGMSQMMNIMYLDGQFEKSMLIGVRNVKYRKQPPYFSLGILRAKGTIENCIGQKAGHPLRDHYEIIRELAWLKNMSMQKGNPKRKMNRKLSMGPTKGSISTGINPSKAVKPFKTILKKEINVNQEQESLSKTDKEDQEVIQDSEISEPKDSSDGESSAAQPMANSTDGESSAARLNKPIYRTISAELEVPRSPSAQSVESSLEDSIAERKPTLKLPKVKNFPYKPLQRRTKNIENFISCAYLGELFEEKKFLTRLPQIPGCVGKNKVSNDVIIDASNEGVETLDAAKEVLRARRPFYQIKYEQMTKKSRKIEMDKQRLLERRQFHTVNKIDKYFTNIAMFARNMDLYHMSKMAELMYKYLTKTDKIILPDKDTVLCRLYKLVGDGYFLSNRFLPEMTLNQKLTRTRLALGLPIIRTNSQESLCKKIMGRSFNWTDLIDTYKQRVKLCKYTEELIWLYHELCRFNIEIGQLGIAKNNAVKCTYESRKIEEFEWAVNGYLLMTKISVRQKNKRDAIRHLASAVTTSKSMDNEEVHTFLQTCMQVLDEYKFEGAKVGDLLRQRQMRMIRLFDSQTKKNEVYNIFENINSKPYRRRLPVIPGLVDINAHLKREEKEKVRKDDYENPKRGREAEDMIASYLPGNMHTL